MNKPTSFPTKNKNTKHNWPLKDQQQKRKKHDKNEFSNCEFVSFRASSCEAIE